MNALKEINIPLPYEVSVYKGKVRNVYILGDKFVSVASDRISAFDHILPKAIPYKGQVLNQIAAFFLEAVKDIVPIWYNGSPLPNVSEGKTCIPIRLEMVIRAYLCGHAWREYKSGKRLLCGVHMPEGMQENDPFPQPIITPTLKAEFGHDIDISPSEIISKNIVSSDQWDQLVNYTHALFKRGSSMALSKGLILVDTKYEFGMFDSQITLMDEIHTPDSSRYFYLEPYIQNQLLSKKQEQLSKEFVREWLILNNFQGLEGQLMPEMPEELIATISNRYIQLYEYLTDLKFQPIDYSTIEEEISSTVRKSLGV